MTAREREPDPLYEPDPDDEELRSDAIPYDEEYIASRREAVESSLLNPSKIHLHDKFFDDWAPRLEAVRKKDFGSPISPESLKRAFEGLEFIADAMEKITGEGYAPSFSLSPSERKQLSKVFDTIARQIAKYDQIRSDGRSVDAPLRIPESHAMKRALQQAREAVDAMPRTPRSDESVALIVDYVKIEFRKLTGVSGRTVDRETGVEEGDLFELSLDVCEAIMSQRDACELPSRIRTAIRRPQ